MKKTFAFVLVSSLLLIGPHQAMGAPPDSLCNRFTEKGERPCMPNGFISYDGYWERVTGEDQFIAWPYIAEDWPNRREEVRLHFRKIRRDFHARAVRLLVHTALEWPGNPGVTFPKPTEADIRAWRDIIDTAAGENLEVVLVMLAPEVGAGYLGHHPDSCDTSDCSTCPKGECFKYANNGATLRQNVYDYWTIFFREVLANGGRIKHIMYLNMQGDLNLAIPNHEEWLRATWPNFYTWFDFIPNDKKIFEIGNTSTLNPAQAIESQIQSAHRIIESLSSGDPRVKKPSKFSISGYAIWDWVSHKVDGVGNIVWPLTSDREYSSRYGLWIKRAIAAAGGADKIIVEEIGSAQCPEYALDDHTEGVITYSSELAAITESDANGHLIPTGIWAFQNAGDGGYLKCEYKLGLFKDDGTLSKGAWVIPWYFGKVPPPPP